jgi:hypothetical protein
MMHDTYPKQTELETQLSRRLQAKLSIIRLRPQIPLITTRFIVQGPSTQIITLLALLWIIRVQMVQQAPKGVHTGDTISAPEAPCAADEDGQEGHGEERGVKVRHEEGLGVCFIGENCL